MTCDTTQLVCIFSLPQWRTNSRLPAQPAALLPSGTNALCPLHLELATEMRGGSTLQFFRRSIKVGLAKAVR
jgi:hypothetical protein